MSEQQERHIQIKLKHVVTIVVVLITTIGSLSGIIYAGLTKDIDTNTEFRIESVSKTYPALVAKGDSLAARIDKRVWTDSVIIKNQEEIMELIRSKHDGN